MGGFLAHNFMFFYCVSAHTLIVPIVYRLCITNKEKKKI